MQISLSKSIVSGAIFLAAVLTVQAQDLTENSTGTHNGFYYSFWKDAGNVTFGLREGGRYTSQWSNINNWVGGKGWNPGGRKIVNYSGSYNVDNSQNSYLALYGWTRNPLIEYYVIESYGSYNPSSCTTGRQTFGTFQSDGATYSLVRCQRIQQPSIEGTQTFYQYFSVREPKKGFGSISGTITTGNHFDAWQRAGLNLGTHDYMVMATEGYQSSGSSDITVSEGSAGGNNNGGNSNNGGNNNGGNNGSNNNGGNNGSNNNGGGNGNNGGNSNSGKPSSTPITVRARGVAGGEHINLRIGDTVVQDWTLTSDFANYTYSGSAVGDIQVEFDNDGDDRDVILDYVFVNGETRQAEEMEYNTSTYDGECGGGSYSDTMHCNGVIGFGGTGDCFSGNCNSGNAPSENPGNNPSNGNNGNDNNGNVGNGNNNPPVNNNNGGGNCECNWYGSRYALCESTNGGWGWENNRSCIGRDTCGDQYGDGGVVCN